MFTSPNKAWSNVCCFGFEVQKKNQTINRIFGVTQKLPITPTSLVKYLFLNVQGSERSSTTSVFKLPLEVPKAPTKALSIMCFYQFECQATIRVFELLYTGNAHNFYERLNKWVCLVSEICKAMTMTYT